MSEDKIKVSIIMSVFNQDESQLRKSIESILGQTYDCLDFIIVDDGSTDKNCIEVLNEYASQDLRIKLIKNKRNMGLTKSLNKALEITSGSFIARQDADDISFPNRIQKQLEFALRHDYDLIASNCEFIDNNEKIIKIKREFAPNNFREKLFKGNFFTHSTFFGKRKVFEEKYNENFKKAQDYEFLLRIAGKAYRLGYMEEPLIKYRISSKSISLTNAKEQEFFALKARWHAIKKYGYSKKYLIYFIKPLISFLLPAKLKYFIIFKIFRFQ